MNLLAYPQGEQQKFDIIAVLEEHAKADRLVKGQYWENGKGCAVGCTIQSGNYAEYEPRFGIPQALARLEDTIFENLPNEQAMTWPVRFMSAIEPNAELSLVQWQFLEFVVSEALSRPEAESVREACQPALDIVRAAGRGEPIDGSAESAAWSAGSAAWSAGSAERSAESAAWSARSAAWSAGSAAWSAGSAAWSAGSAAWNAARSAAWSAESAAWSARSAAWSAARSAAWVRYSEKLLELMAVAPIGKPQ